MPRMDRLSNYRTTISQHVPGITVVTYVSTAIVQFTRDTVKLNSGGWRTVTTKRKMNQAARQFNLGYRVIQRNGDWIVEPPYGERIAFEDGMSFRRAPAVS